jgi:heat-inducible transcriptional repressor
LAIHEFLNEELSRTVFEKLDELAFWEKLLDKIQLGNDEIYFLLGQEDFNDPAFDLCASIFGEFEGKGIKGMIGVVGPRRMYYDVLTPQVKYFSGLLDQIIKEEKK